MRKPWEERKKIPRTKEAAKKESAREAGKVYKPQDRKYKTKGSNYIPGRRKGSSKQALKKVSSGAAGELLRRSGRKMGPGPKDALTMRESLLKKAGLKKPKKKKY